MTEKSNEVEIELLPYQKYSHAISICNNLALLASQCTTLVFVQRITVLKGIESCWMKGLQAAAVPSENSATPCSADESNGPIIDSDRGIDFGIKLEPEFSDPRFGIFAGDGDGSSGATIADEQLLGGVELIEEDDRGKIETMIKKDRLVAGSAETTTIRKRPRAKEKKEKAARKGKKLVKKEPKETEESSQGNDNGLLIANNSESSYKFLCLSCKDVFDTFPELKEHKTQVHESVSFDDGFAETKIAKKVHCPICCKAFRDSYQMKRHFVVHREAIIESPGSVAIDESPKDDIQCSVCNKTFQFAYQMKRHAVVHTGEKPFMCSYCGVRFSKREILRSHVRVHSGDRPYRCGLCNKHFIQASNLKYHIRSHHTGEKPFVCTECGKQFRQATLLKYHTRVHTGERPCVCSLCDRRFARPTQLREHWKLHSDAKTYGCRECGKTFRLHSTLNKHRKIHLEVKPYKCSECGRTFTQVHNMKVHMRTHTGQKPYTCEHCGKMFAHQGTLKKHLELHSVPTF